MPTIIGLALTAVFGLAGLVALRPQVGVSPEEPLERAQPLSASFRITNSGLLELKNVSAMGYIRHFEIPGTVVVDDFTFRPEGWSAGTLDRGESQTLVWNIAHLGRAVPPAKADIAIVVDCPLPLLPAYHSRRYFRFTGQLGDNWRWSAQPSGPIQSDIDAAIARHLAEFAHTE